MRAKDFPQPLVATLVEQVQIDVAQRRQETVGVSHRNWLAIAVADLETVIDEIDERQRDGEQARVDVLQREPVRTDQRDHFRGMRPERSDHGVVAVFVRTQDAVRVVVLPGQQASQIAGFGCQIRFGELVAGLHRGVTSRRSSGIRASDGMSGMLMMWATARPGSIRT